MTLERRRVLSIIVLMIIVSLFYYQYQQKHITIWGFNLSKNDIKDIIVLTENNSYEIKKRDTVIKIVENVSKMKKFSEIEPNNYPSQTQHEQYKKLLIRTKDNVTYGGSLWIIDDNIVMDSNGYYWGFDNNKIINTLNASLKNATLMNVGFR